MGCFCLKIFLNLLRLILYFQRHRRYYIKSIFPFLESIFKKDNDICREIKLKNDLVQSDLIGHFELSLNRD